MQQRRENGASEHAAAEAVRIRGPQSLAVALCTLSITGISVLGLFQSRNHTGSDEGKGIDGAAQS
jgi:hypothetical protein